MLSASVSTLACAAVRFACFKGKKPGRESGGGQQDRQRHQKQPDADRRTERRGSHWRDAQALLCAFSAHSALSTCHPGKPGRGASTATGVPIPKCNWRRGGRSPSCGRRTRDRTRPPRPRRPAHQETPWRASFSSSRAPARRRRPLPPHVSRATGCLTPRVCADPMTERLGVLQIQLPLPTGAREQARRPWKTLTFRA